MKRSTLFICILFFSLKSFSQTALLKGKVRDSATKESIPGASVFDANDNKVVAVTDDQGNYSLSIGAGRHQITCSFVGLNSETIEIDFREAETVVYN